MVGGGGGAPVIYRRDFLASRNFMLHAAASCGVRPLSLSANAAPPQSYFSSKILTAFYIFFKTAFYGYLVLKTGHSWYIGKIENYSFQRYHVRSNRSSDERVMAPGSKGVRAVFLYLSDEDSGQTGDVTGEPRVTRCSRSYLLSSSFKLAGQLVAS